MWNVTGLASCLSCFVGYPEAVEGVFRDLFLNDRADGSPAMLFEMGFCLFQVRHHVASRCEGRRRK